MGDASAKKLANMFYGALLDGQALGDALYKGREEGDKLNSLDWADYIFYGSVDFRIKDGSRS